MAQFKKKKKINPDSWKDYFSFNNRVRRGLVVLISLISLEIIVLIYLHYLPASAEKIDVDKFKKEIDEFYAANKDSTGENDSPESVTDTKPEFNSRYKNDDKENRVRELFAFNPNHLPAEDWKRLGFSEKQIHSIQNYESKGGKFRTKDDVKKMYAINEKEFNRIEPYIVIPEPVKEVSNHSEGNIKNFLIVDIGTADSTELDKLPMVGSFLARKIFSYREKLGGFYSLEQLKEVRGLRDSALLVILPHVMLKDSTNLRRINVNTADYEELSRHPYIDNTVANLILSYRKQHGPYREVDDLRKVALVDGELYRKIAPYLKVE